MYFNKFILTNIPILFCFSSAAATLYFPTFFLSETLPGFAWTCQRPSKFTLFLPFFQKLLSICVNDLNSTHQLQKQWTPPPPVTYLQHSVTSPLLRSTGRRHLIESSSVFIPLISGFLGAIKEPNEFYPSGVTWIAFLPYVIIDFLPYWSCPTQSLDFP